MEGCGRGTGEERDTVMKSHMYVQSTSVLKLTDNSYFSLHLNIPKLVLEFHIKFGPSTDI